MAKTGRLHKNFREENGVQPAMRQRMNVCYRKRTPNERDSQVLRLFTAVGSIPSVWVFARRS